MPFMSCSSDEDNSNDPITAEWVLTAEKEIVNEEEIDMNISNCRKTSTLQFYGDGMAVIVSYSDPQEGDNVTCVFDGSSKGSWKNLGGGQYSITDESGNTKSGEFTFDDNTMTVRYSGDDGTIISIYTLIEDY